MFRRINEFWRSVCISSSSSYKWLIACHVRLFTPPFLRCIYYSIGWNMHKSKINTQHCPLVITIHGATEKYFFCVRIVCCIMKNICYPNSFSFQPDNGNLLYQHMKQNVFIWQNGNLKVVSRKSFRSIHFNNDLESQKNS